MWRINGKYLGNKGEVMREVWVGISRINKVNLSEYALLFAFRVYPYCWRMAEATGHFPSEYCPLTQSWHYNAVRCCWARKGRDEWGNIHKCHRKWIHLNRGQRPDLWRILKFWLSMDTLQETVLTRICCGKCENGCVYALSTLIGDMSIIGHFRQRRINRALEKKFKHIFTYLQPNSSKFKV